MKYKQIYDHALAILGETSASSGNKDYLARTPILLFGIVSEFSRTSEALTSVSVNVTSPPSLTDDFPLDKRLALPSALNLAAQLVFDESADQSEMLSSKAKELVGAIAAEVGTIREVYP